jgi:hypothetical protein
VAGKSFREDRAFRLVGLVIMTGWLGIGTVTQLWPYLHPADQWAIPIGLIGGAFQIAFYAWMLVFLWRWIRGDYRAEIETQRARTNLPSIRFSIWFWIGVALLLVFAFNVIPDVVKDNRIAGLIVKAGPLVLLVAVWIGFWFWMRRDRKG